MLPTCHIPRASRGVQHQRQKPSLQRAKSYDAFFQDLQEAMDHLDTSGDISSRQDIINILLPFAKAGDSTAQFALGSELMASGDKDVAERWLYRAATELANQ